MIIRLSLRVLRKCDVSWNDSACHFVHKSYESALRQPVGAGFPIHCRATLGVPGVPLWLTTPRLRGYLFLREKFLPGPEWRNLAVSVAQLKCLAGRASLPFLAVTTGLVKGHNPGIPGLTPQLASCQLARRLSKSNLCEKSLLHFFWLETNINKDEKTCYGCVRAFDVLCFFSIHLLLDMVASWTLSLTQPPKASIATWSTPHLMELALELVMGQVALN